jgi:hypothetical protein
MEALIARESTCGAQLGLLYSLSPRILHKSYICIYIIVVATATPPWRNNPFLAFLAL